MALMEDSADRHVARWSGIEEFPFDEQVEAAVFRLHALVRHLRRTKERAVAEVGLQGFEYDTLHDLMVRATPGIASPSELADDMQLSPAGMTGRLDTLERSGLIRRGTIPADRRRVVVEITRKGRKLWRQAFDLRGEAEDELLAPLSDTQRRTLNRLLKRLLLPLDNPRH
jgi:DNA-binding MarR family transcriptional regulator